MKPRKRASSRGQSFRLSRSLPGRRLLMVSRRGARSSRNAPDTGPRSPERVIGGSPVHAEHPRTRRGRIGKGVRTVGRDGVFGSPVARFSLALGAVLAATALALSAGAAYLISRYVADETTSFTQDAVASHFGTVFSDDVFQRRLNATEESQLTQYVTFHFSIYNVVATEFYDKTGTIVFSYDADEIGRTIDMATEPALVEALKGIRSSERSTIVADPRLAVPGSTVGYGPYDTHHMEGMTAGQSLPPNMASISTLEAWIPVLQKGEVVGAGVVYRGMGPIHPALMRIQLTLAAIILAAALLLWLVLRGVYLRSSRQILAQAHELERALADRERTYDATLEALANALDVRDSETGGPTDRVLPYMEA